MIRRTGFGMVAAVVCAFVMGAAADAQVGRAGVGEGIGAGGQDREAAASPMQDRSTIRAQRGVERRERVDRQRAERQRRAQDAPDAPRTRQRAQREVEPSKGSLIATGANASVRGRASDEGPSIVAARFSDPQRLVVQPVGARSDIAANRVAIESGFGIFPAADRPLATSPSSDCVHCFASVPVKTAAHSGTQ